jgi:hypothetical protein
LLDIEAKIHHLGGLKEPPNTRGIYGAGTVCLPTVLDTTFTGVSVLLRNLEPIAVVPSSAGHIAYIEPHNEVDYSSLPRGDEGKRLHTETIAFLRERHPDILVSGDFGKKDVDTLPDNTQIYDYLIYVGGTLYHGEVFNKTIFAPDFDPQHPNKNKLLELLLEDNIVPYDEFMAHTTIASQSWAARMWLYHNLNVAQFDRWILDKYAEHETKLKQNARTLYAFHAREAAKWNLPVVVEEDGFWYGPLNSRWEESETGLAFYDFLTDLAIEHNFWGL